LVKGKSSVSLKLRAKVPFLGVMPHNPRSDTLPKLSAEQTTSVLLNFADTLGAFAHQLPIEERQLGSMLEDVAHTVRNLAREIGHGDIDVANEVMQSAARLIGVMRQVISQRSENITLH